VTDVAAGMGRRPVLTAEPVPYWRYRVRGAEAIRAEYANWFNEPVTFLELQRIPVPGGELVTYEHEWVENRVRHRGYHAHQIATADGRITADTVWCGGRWPEPLLLDMAAAGRAT